MIKQTGMKADVTKPVYEPPKVTVMSEEDVLRAFQVTSAGVSWWVS